MDKQRLKYLLTQWYSTVTTAAEEEELSVFMEGCDNNQEIFAMVRALWNENPVKERDESERTFVMINNILDTYPAETYSFKTYPAETHLSTETRQPGVYRIYFFKTAWFRYAAAIILLFGAGIYLFLSNKKENQQSLTNSNKYLQTDITPGGNRAVLTLADGTQLVLDSAANGNLAQQGNTSIIKLANGQVTYNLQGLAEGGAMVNTMSTPKGGQYQLTLPDGTKVWLNAASSIMYPTAFVGKQRKVKITGEAYIEVAKNIAKPFMVDIDEKSTIQVLGTSFNINSYADEGSIKTTLLEGSIKVIKADQSAILKPGQQAQIVIKSVAAATGKASENGLFSVDRQPLAGITVISNADIKKALAWKNGLFDFNQANIYSVMRQLERWYDIKVSYEGNVSTIQLVGSLSRDLNLSQILEVLNELEINYRLQGRNLIIKGT